MSKRSFEEQFARFVEETGEHSDPFADWYFEGTPSEKSDKK